ncbi:hypothetical protein LBMAG42_01970 [Deltaproteobacteria bacterium]|nr:hypothetical protein LBMAG42_01970 [Deltaproteobacteria bacterium]
MGRTSVDGKVESASEQLLSITYGDADGAVRSVTGTGTGGSLAFRDYADSYCENLKFN